MKQALFVELLEQGGSPAVACKKLGVSYQTFATTLHAVPEFRRRCEEVDASLGENVAAALYRAAMEGSVTAQTFWLKHHPPPGWNAPIPPERQTELDLLSKISDDELVELARLVRLGPAPEDRRGAAPSGDPPGSVDLPADPPPA